MAAASAGGVKITIEGDGSSLKATLNSLTREIQKSTSEWSNQFASAAKSLEQLKQGMQVYGLTKAFEEVKKVITAVFDELYQAGEAANQMKNLAGAIGVTTTQLQALQSAGQTVGVNTDQMSTALEKVTRDLGEAADGNKELQGAFKALGVTVRDAQGNTRSTSDVFRDLVARFSSMSNESEKARLAAQLFGRDWASVLPVLNAGTSNLDAANEMAGRLGGSLSGETLDALDEFSTHWDQLKTRIHNVVVEILSNLLPPLEWAIAHINQLIDWAGSKEGEQTQRELGQQIEANRIEIEKLQNSTYAAFEDMIHGAGYAAQRVAELADQSRQLNDQLATMKDLAAGKYISVPAPPGLGSGTGGDYGATKTTGKTEAEKQAEAVKKVIDALRAETEAIGQDAIQQRLLNALKTAGVAAESDYGQQIRAEWEELKAATAAQKAKADAEKEYQDDLKNAQQLLDQLTPKTDKLAESQKQLNLAYAMGLIDDEQYAAAQKELTKQMDAAAKKADEFTKQLQEGVNSALTDVGSSLADLATGAKTWQQVMQDALRSILNDLLKVLDAATKGGSSGSGLGGILGDIATSIFGSLFGGGDITSSIAPGAGTQLSANVFGSITPFANGGYLPPGQVGMVGEAGPELMLAGKLGASVMPNAMLKGSTTMGSNVAYIDARGADMAAVARIERSLNALNYSVEHRAVAAVNAQRKRGGTFAAAFSR